MDRNGLSASTPHGDAPFPHSLAAFIGLYAETEVVSTLADDGLISEAEEESFYNMDLGVEDYDPEIQMRPFVKMSYERYRQGPAASGQ